MTFKYKIKVIQNYFFFVATFLCVAFEFGQVMALGASKLNDQLFSAVANNNLVLVRSTITAGANIEAVNEEGLTAAELAVERGYFNIAHYILAIKNIQPEIKKEIKTPQVLPSTDSNKSNHQNSIANIKTQSKKPMKEKFQRKGIQLEKKNIPWQESKPNPFSPESRPGTIPIIGTLKKSSVKPVIPKETIISISREQIPKTFPLKTNANAEPREIKKPTPLKPVDEVVIESDYGEKKGFFLRWGDILKPRQNDQLRETKSKTVTAKSTEDDDGKSAGFMDEFWQRLNKIF